MATITEHKLRRIVKESVQEALSGELMKLRALAVPEVSDREQKDIERRHQKPSRRIARTVNVVI